MLQDAFIWVLDVLGTMMCLGAISHATLVEECWCDPGANDKSSHGSSSTLKLEPGPPEVNWRKVISSVQPNKVILHF